MQFRTDLAKESVENNNVGFKNTEFELFGINGNTVEITDESLGKRKGKYISLESNAVLNRNVEEYENISKAISCKLNELLGDINNKTLLVAGLGNENMTPDSIGPKTVDGVLVTRHIFKFLPDEVDERMNPVCAFKPGVLGVTGIESADIIYGICKNNGIDGVIVVDALAARRKERMFSTFQLTDTGIEPGAGVGNKRSGLNSDTLGIPVIAIGVPTVVYSSSLVYDALYQYAGNDEEQLEDAVKSFLNENDMVVTPKEIDVIAMDSAKIIADGINLALHRDISLEEINAYMF